MKLHYDLNKTQDLQVLFWKYSLNKIFDSLAHLQRAELEIEDLNSCPTAMKHRHEVLHVVKDLMYEVLLVSSNEHIIDLIFAALLCETPDEVEEAYLYVVETLKHVYDQLANVHSQRYEMFMSHIQKKWKTVGKDIAMKSRMYFHCESVRIKEMSV